MNHPIYLIIMGQENIIQNLWLTQIKLDCKALPSPQKDESSECIYIHRLEKADVDVNYDESYQLVLHVCMLREQEQIYFPVQHGLELCKLLVSGDGSFQCCHLGYIEEGESENVQGQGLL